MLLAPVLQDVAARMAGADPRQRLETPDRWAYVLRDAIALAAPDWIVTHHDLELEAQALADITEDPDDVAFADLSASRPGAAALELTATLAALYPGAEVAASVTGPATVAAGLSEHAPFAGADRDALWLDCGDALAALAAAHAGRGATRVIVWEGLAADADGDAARDAHEAIVRRLAHAGVPALLAGPEALDAPGYSARADLTSGRGARLLAAAAFSDWERLERALDEAAGSGGVALSDGPVPGDCDLPSLRRLGERTNKEER